MSGNVQGHIDVVHKIDVDSALNYFRISCARRLPNATQAEIEDCAQDELFKLVDTLGNVKITPVTS